MKMRFAIFCRVSTETQKQDGQSLDVQESLLRQQVELLDGEVTKTYIGSESATGDDINSRELLSELLKDAENQAFDCLMVYDASRLSRNSITFRIIMSKLAKLKIRLFIQSQEQDFNSPENKLILGIMTEFNSYIVDTQKQKSLKSKMELARRGWTTSKNPYGRRPIHNNKKEQCQWEIIPECQEETWKVYDMYVEQCLSIEKISKETGIAEAQVRAILFEHSGNKWSQTFKISETETEVIVTEVPPLLTEEQIEKAKYRASTNRKFNSRKYQYLLGGMIKCSICGAHLVGSSGSTVLGTKHYKKRYYTHPRYFKESICIRTINVDLIEAALFRTLNHLFSSSENIKKAVENALDAIPEEKESIEKQILECEEKILDIEKRHRNLVRLIESNQGGYNDEAYERYRIISNEMMQEKSLLDKLKRKLKAVEVNIPDDLHWKIQQFWEILSGQSMSNIEHWDVNCQQDLLNWFFGNSKETGVFVAQEGKKKIVNIRGVLGSGLIGIFDENEYHSYIADCRASEKMQGEQLVEFKKVVAKLEKLTRIKASGRTAPRLVSAIG